MQDRPAAMPSRSSLRGEFWRAASNLPWPEHPDVCPPFRPHPSLPPRENAMTLDIRPTETPAHLRHGSNIGQPLTRRDGVLKVTGSAIFAADNHPAGMLHAVLATSSIARGRVTFLDVDAAKNHP